MRDTFEMMKLVIIGYEKRLSDIELIQEYKKNQAPNILAYLFVSNYGLINIISKNYGMLDEQDVASYCLQELDKAMYQFDETRQCGFITFFSSCFKNRLRYEQELLLTHTRYANYCTENIDNHIDIEDVNFSIDSFDIDSYDLSLQEKKQCKLLIDGFTIKEIAIKFNTTVQTIYNRNKNISKKLLKTL